HTPASAISASLVGSETCITDSLTSALALIPLAINGDKTGNEIQAPLATVILGGLVTSTILNIYVVPAVYRLINCKKSTKA
ncbi:MAG: efflux RND transporter permease subunit, partial [Muribaculaceae bacterium]|nr:efflux RND transporter permease subunit [Muribaculaceae bacterium]